MQTTTIYAATCRQAYSIDEVGAHGYYLDEPQSTDRVKMEETSRFDVLAPDDVLVWEDPYHGVRVRRDGEKLDYSVTAALREGLIRRSGRPA